MKGIIREQEEADAFIDYEIFGRSVMEHMSEYRIKGSIQLVVAVLKNMGIPNEIISMTLGISPQSVSNAWRKAKERMSMWESSVEEDEEEEI